MSEIELLCELLEKGVSPAHTVRACADRLAEAGFVPLSYKEEWRLKPGGNYMLTHHDTSLFAFTMPDGEGTGDGPLFRAAVAHTDFPCLRIKPSCDIRTKAYAQVNVEVYGGAILNTWLDRPLGVAGRVALRGENVFCPRICHYRSKNPVLIIPNLAIHMNREINKGVELNRQTDLLPIAGLSGEEADESYFLDFLAEELAVKKEDILDFELTAYCDEKPQLVGVKRQLLSAPRLDNITSCSAVVSALSQSKRRDGINLAALFDHEEIGSQSKQGAASLFLRDLMARILREAPGGMFSPNAAYDSMLLSADVAHGLHPNHAGKMDPTNQPVLGKGFCVKESSAQSYATDCRTVAVVQQLCEKHRIPFQKFVNRSDVAGGRTIGAVVSALLPIEAADIGVPILAMHSARELMAASDQDALVRVISSFFDE